MNQGFLTPKRRNLEALVGQSIRVTAVYDRIGNREALGRSYPTVLVLDVREAKTGTLLADHLWFNRGNTWKKVAVARGDRLHFIARAIEYRGGYWGPNPLRRKVDPPRVEYKLTPPKVLAVMPADAGQAVVDPNKQQIRTRRRRRCPQRLPVQLSASDRRWRTRLSGQVIRYRRSNALRRRGGVA